ncbi:hypothetical protein ACLTEW_23425 [Gordonia lacunae]|uniref:hypothetical protein n=1 Tax=Gordonia lacunae TaxID=417102 RepID=UPI0039E39A70
MIYVSLSVAFLSACSAIVAAIVTIRATRRDAKANWRRDRIDEAYGAVDDAIVAIRGHLHTRSREVEKVTPGSAEYDEIDARTRTNLGECSSLLQRSVRNAQVVGRDAFWQLEPGLRTITLQVLIPYSIPALGSSVSAHNRVRTEMRALGAAENALTLARRLDLDLSEDEDEAAEDMKTVIDLGRQLKATRKAFTETTDVPTLCRALAEYLILPMPSAEGNYVLSPTLMAQVTDPGSLPGPVEIRGSSVVPAATGEGLLVAVPSGVLMKMPDSGLLHAAVLEDLPQYFQAKILCRIGQLVECAFDLMGSNGAVATKLGADGMQFIWY